MENSLGEGGRKNTDIQCLRAIAIIFVLIQHYRGRLPTPTLYYKLFEFVTPWAGVDLFFAISGFLVCKTLIEHLRREPKSTAYANFWRRRCARLLPALVFWATVSIAVGAFAGPSVAQGALDAAKGAVVGMIGVANVYWAHCVQHGFSSCVQTDYNSHFWSLALEWQLYVLLALLVALLRFQVAMAAFGLLALLASTFPAPSFSYAWALRPQAFFLGALIFAITQAYPKLLSGRHAENAWLSRGTLVLGLLITFCAPNLLKEPYVIPTVGVGAAIALASTLCTGSTYPALLSRPLEWIGERSYSLYLCHLSIIYSARKLLLITLGFDNPSSVLLFVPCALAMVCISLLAADVSYRLIERPMIKRFSPKNDGSVKRRPISFVR